MTWAVAFWCAVLLEAVTLGVLVDRWQQYVAETAELKLRLTAELKLRLTAAREKSNLSVSPDPVRRFTDEPSANYTYARRATRG